MHFHSLIRSLSIHGAFALVDEKVLEGLIPDEVAAYRYFDKGTPHGMSMEVPRYSDLTVDRFEELALSGRPFIIADGAKGQPFAGWTCDRFGKEFPNGVVKVEYIKGIKATWKITDNWQEEVHPIPNSDPNGPQYGPWYWGVKAADEPEEKRAIYTGKKNPLPKVQASMRLPPWMRKTPENQGEVFGSPEFWFSMPKAGAAMHMDAHCESTYAIQLSGKRKWRLGWVPPVPNGTAYRSGTYGDGAIYGKEYQPPLEAVVSEGEALYMPSGFLHETSNVGDGCAVSLTVQFSDPIPARYFRQSLRHLRRTQDFNECWELLQQVASLGNAKAKKAPDIANVDKNGDGVFTVDEASNRILRAGHAFHDIDMDGVVRPEELASGWSEWLAANKEAKSVKRTLPKSFAYVVLQQKAEL